MLAMVKKASGRFDQVDGSVDHNSKNAMSSDENHIVDNKYLSSEGSVHGDDKTGSFNNRDSSGHTL